MRTDLKKARNGVIAAALGAALLMGGGTYALWTTQADLNGGTITAGNMSITADETTPFLAFDISADRLDTTEDAVEIGGVSVDKTGAPITDLSTWRMVPGDTVALLFNYDLLLEGDNLQATLSLDGLDGANGFEHLTLAGTLYDSNGLPLAVVDADEAQVDGLTQNDSGRVVLVIYATFDPDFTGTGDDSVYDAGAILNLANAVSLTLTQDDRSS
ncbi:MAG: alternate-type signal peptide domain-containing protein [Propionibacteriaceae bacterium]|nr:alternate-type signal peptide domain-containing protein [Propionibacteriaceae bacterium]